MVNFDSTRIKVGIVAVENVLFRIITYVNIYDWAAVNFGVRVILQTITSYDKYISEDSWILLIIWGNSCIIFIGNTIDI